MRVLVIEDNSKIAATLCCGLTEFGHQVQVCSTAEQGKLAASTPVTPPTTPAARTAPTSSTLPSFDAIVLDVDLPDRSGVLLCRELRRMGIDTPILMLTVFSATADKVQGLEAGADDYLTKPFELEELEARLKALQRRSQRYGGAVRSYGDLQLDMPRHIAIRGGRQINLTRREFDLLELLMRNAGRLLSREDIANAIWGNHSIRKVMSSMYTFTRCGERSIADLSSS